MALGIETRRTGTGDQIIAAAGHGRCCPIPDKVTGSDLWVAEAAYAGTRLGVTTRRDVRSDGANVDYVNAVGSELLRHIAGSGFSAAASGGRRSTDAVCRVGVARGKVVMMTIYVLTWRRTDTETRTQGDSAAPGICIAWVSEAVAGERSGGWEFGFA